MQNLIDNIQAIHTQASTNARAKANEWLAQYGDCDACGFAWVTVYGIRSNSKLGKALATVGFSKAYNGGLQLWNPSRVGTQSITALEQGATAYADYIKSIEPTLEIYSGSRMD